MNICAKIAVLLLFPIWVFGAENPIFDNGRQSLSYFIQSHLEYPEYSKLNCIQGRVMVSFQLSATGNVNNVQIQQGTGVDLDDEALRLVHLTQGKWKVSKGYDTTQRIEIPIDFSLNSSSCFQVSKSQIEQAKYQYQSDQVFTQSIMNFYKSKYNGDGKNAADEKDIQVLRDKLGFDDEYFEQELKLAKRALKKGDLYTAKTKALRIKYLGSSIADDFITSQAWK